MLTCPILPSKKGVGMGQGGGGRAGVEVFRESAQEKGSGVGLVVVGKWHVWRWWGWCV